MLDSVNFEIKEKARHVAENVVRPLASEHDKKQEYPWKVKEALAESGLLKTWIPKEYGGNGLGSLNLCLVVEELSRACGGVGVMFAVNALGSYPIILGGREEQKQKWLPEIANGDRLISFALSEKMAGSNASDLKTLISKNDSEYVINGDKKWNTNGGVAHYYSVFGVTNPSQVGKPSAISAVIVEKGTEGFELGKEEDKMGIRCVPVRELYFRDCAVPKWNLLGDSEGKGFKIAMETLDHARPGVAAQALGCAQGAFEYASRFASRRRQFGQPIQNHQSIGFLLADMSTRIEAARQLVYESARMIDAADKDPSLKAKANKMAAQGKLFATDTAMWVTTEAVQIFGGYGFMKDYPVEKYMRDAKITQIYEGTNQIQRLVVSRHVAREATSLKFLDTFIPTIDQWIPEELLNEVKK